MNHETLTALEEAYKASTQGEYKLRIVKSQYGGVSSIVTETEKSIVFYLEYYGKVFEETPEVVQELANHAFVMLAHNHFPALLELARKGLQLVDYEQKQAEEIVHLPKRVETLVAKIAKIGKSSETL